MNELQALVTGILMGSLARMTDPNSPFDIMVVPQYDNERNYLPEFVVYGNVSGTKLRVKVELEEG